MTDSGEEAGTQVQPARSNARGANTGADLQEVSQRRPQDEPTITQTTASARAAPAAILEEEAVSPASAAQPQQQQQPLPVQQQLPPTKGSFKIKFSGAKLGAQQDAAPQGGANQEALGKRKRERPAPGETAMPAEAAKRPKREDLDGDIAAILLEASGHPAAASKRVSTPQPSHAGGASRPASAAGYQPSGRSPSPSPFASYPPLDRAPDKATPPPSPGPLPWAPQLGNGEKKKRSAKSRTPPPPPLQQDPAAAAAAEAERAKVLADVMAIASRPASPAPRRNKKTPPPVTAAAAWPIARTPPPTPSAPAARLQPPVQSAWLSVPHSAPASAAAASQMMPPPAATAAAQTTAAAPRLKLKFSQKAPAAQQQSRSEGVANAGHIRRPLPASPFSAPGVGDASGVVGRPAGTGVAGPKPRISFKVKGAAFSGAPSDTVSLPSSQLGISSAPSVSRPAALGAKKGECCLL